MGRTGRALALIATGAALLVAGCGDEESTSTAADESTAIEDTTSSTEDTSQIDTSSTSTTTEFGDLDAIEETVRLWITEGGCERMTDNFLEEQVFDDNPKTACETFEAQFTPPAYGPDDFEVDITYENDKAEAEVSSPGIDVTSVYHLVKEGETWKIDSAELE